MIDCRVLFYVIFHPGEQNSIYSKYSKYSFPVYLLNILYVKQLYASQMNIKKYT